MILLPFSGEVGICRRFCQVATSGHRSCRVLGLNDDDNNGICRHYLWNDDYRDVNDDDAAYDRCRVSFSSLSNRF